MAFFRLQAEFKGLCFLIASVAVRLLNPLKTNDRPLYLKTQFVPRSKHFSSRL